MVTRCILSQLNILLKTNCKLSHINNFKGQIRFSSYQNSKLIKNIDDFKTKFEVTRLPEDWKYVERLLVSAIAPVPKSKTEYSSGWKPSKDNLNNGPYFIARTKNHMMPVYLASTHRGMRKVTVIRKVYGDVFQLENDLKCLLEKYLGKDIAIQSNEMFGYIRIKGDHIRVIKDYFAEKGF